MPRRLYVKWNPSRQKKPAAELSVARHASAVFLPFFDAPLLRPNTSVSSSTVSPCQFFNFASRNTTIYIHVSPPHTGVFQRWRLERQDSCNTSLTIIFYFIMQPFYCRRMGSVLFFGGSHSTLLNSAFNCTNKTELEFSSPFKFSHTCTLYIWTWFLYSIRTWIFLLRITMILVMSSNCNIWLMKIMSKIFSAKTYQPVRKNRRII